MGGGGAIAEASSLAAGAGRVTSVNTCPSPAADCLTAAVRKATREATSASDGGGLSRPGCVGGRRTTRGRIARLLRFVIEAAAALELDEASLSSEGFTTPVSVAGGEAAGSTLAPVAQ